MSACRAGRILPSIRVPRRSRASSISTSAPVDDSGLVRFAADFMILQAARHARGNRRVFYDYGNRGHKRALQFFNDAPHSNAPITLAHAGNGFFMRRGYAVAWLAWEGDMLPGDGRMVLDVPVATDNGQPITGRIRVEYIADVAGHHLLPAQRPDRGAFLCRRLARQPRRRADPPALSIRHAAGDPARPVALRLRRGRQRAARHSRCERAVVPSDAAHLPPGRLPARLDLRACLHGEGSAGARPRPCRGARLHQLPEIRRRSAANPLRGVEKAYAWGRSQTGRCLRDFVYRGFNADAQRATRVRRRAAACGRRRAQVAEPPLRQSRSSPAASNTRTISTSPTASRSPTPGPPTT